MYTLSLPEDLINETINLMFERDLRSLTSHSPCFFYVNTSNMYPLSKRSSVMVSSVCIYSFQIANEQIPWLLFPTRT